MFARLATIVVEEVRAVLHGDIVWLGNLEYTKAIWDLGFGWPRLRTLPVLVGRVL